MRQLLNAFCGFDGSHHMLTEPQLRKLKKAPCLAASPQIRKERHAVNDFSWLCVMRFPFIDNLDILLPFLSATKLYRFLLWLLSLLHTAFFDYAKYFQLQLLDGYSSSDFSR